MGSTDQARDDHGRWTSGGSATGDHQASQSPSAGRGSPVTAHAGQPSVGTSSDKYTGGARTAHHSTHVIQEYEGPPRDLGTRPVAPLTRLSAPNERGNRTSNAAERVNLGRMADARAASRNYTAPGRR